MMVSVDVLMTTTNSVTVEEAYLPRAADERRVSGRRLSEAHPEVVPTHFPLNFCRFFVAFTVKVAAPRV